MPSADNINPTLASAIKLVEFGSKDQVTKDDLERSIGEKTVAVHYVANETINDPNALSLEDTLGITVASLTFFLLSYSFFTASAAT